MTHAVSPRCDEIIANPANTATVGPATVALGNLTKTLGGQARDVASALQGALPSCPPCPLPLSLFLS